MVSQAFRLSKKYRHTYTCSKGDRKMDKACGYTDRQKDIDRYVDTQMGTDEHRQMTLSPTKATH